MIKSYASLNQTRWKQTEGSRKGEEWAEGTVDEDDDDRHDDNDDDDDECFLNNTHKTV